MMFFILKLVSKYRLLIKKEYEPRLQEKFGEAGQNIKQLFSEKKKINNNLKTIWMHGDSIGESLSILNLSIEFANKGFFVILTTRTKTSANVIDKKIKNIDNIIHQYCPYPFVFCVKKFFDFWRPTRVFFAESAILPNVVAFLHKKCDVFLVNARISNRSFKKWLKIKWFISRVLLKYRAIYVSSDIEGEKFKTLSNGKANIKCFGNLKIEASLEFKKEVLNHPSGHIASKCELLKQCSKNENIIVYGSVHKEEFYYLVWQHSMLMKKIPNCVGIFVPRYIEETPELITLFHQNDMEPVLWSDFCGGEYPQILIVNEIGALMYMYNLCKYAVVCGNFSPQIGGHNPLEPLAFEKLTFVGKYCEKCQDLVDYLKNKELLLQTSTICDDISLLHKDTKRQQIIKDKIKEYFQQNNNVKEKILEDIFKEC